MPIPFIIVGATIAMGVTGVGMGAKGGYDQHRAQQLNAESNKRAENASLRLLTVFKSEQENDCISSCYCDEC